MQKAIDFDNNESVEIDKVYSLLKLINDNKFKTFESGKVKILEINNHMVTIR